MTMLIFFFVIFFFRGKKDLAYDSYEMSIHFVFEKKKNDSVVCFSFLWRFKG